MSILSEIVAYKKLDVERRSDLISIKTLEQSIYFQREVISMNKALLRTGLPGIIAEIKRGSPSAGIINASIDVENLSKSYVEAGASALSILTDEKYFSGSTNDLEIARKHNACPILRKDFIINEYQLIESKSMGADCILLIAACLSPNQCKLLADSAKALGLEVLLEVHNEEELASHLSDSIDILGVNNRNLKDFTTDINTSIKLADRIPPELTKISESGISSATQINVLQEKGYNGFLIGTTFMKNENPARACKNLIDQLNQNNA